MSVKIGERALVRADVRQLGDKVVFVAARAACVALTPEIISTFEERTGDRFCNIDADKTVAVIWGGYHLAIMKTDELTTIKQ